MSRSDSEKPPKPAEPTQRHPPPPGIDGSRRAIVNDRPARAPTWTEPAPRRRIVPDAIVIPKNQPPEDRASFIAWLDQQWGGYIQKELARWHDVAEESRKDLRQEVLLILNQHYEKEEKAGHRGAPDHMQKFLERVIRNVASTHVQKKKTRNRWIDQGAEPQEAPDAALDPERGLIRAELLADIERRRALLTTAELEVFEAREVDGMSFAVIATALGRPRSTVDSQHARALEKLRGASGRGTRRR